MTPTATEPRTAGTVKSLVEDVQGDLSEIVAKLTEARDAMAALQAYTKGVNGLTPLLRGKGNEVGAVIDALTEEHDAIPDKLLPSAEKHEITQTVDVEQAKRVAGAVS